MVTEHGCDDRDHVVLRSGGLGDDSTRMDGVETGTVQWKRMWLNRRLQASQMLCSSGNLAHICLYNQKSTHSCDLKTEALSECWSKGKFTTVLPNVSSSGIFGASILAAGLW